MRLAVLKERRASETRVAATPDTVKRLVALGLTVAIEAGAGAEAAIPDREFAPPAPRSHRMPPKRWPVPRSCSPCRCRCPNSERRSRAAPCWSASPTRSPNRS